MDRSKWTTQKAKAITVVIVVGPDKLVQATRKAAAVSTGALTVPCKVVDVATNAAKHRPFAIIVSDEIYNFDTSEFDALAKDVKSVIINLPIDRIPPITLERLLEKKIADAYKLRRKIYTSSD